MINVILIILCTLAMQVEDDIFDTRHDARQYIQDIEVLYPTPLSDVSGKVKVQLRAPHMTQLSARCVRCLTPKGIRLHADGTVSFTVDFRRLPAGPLTIQVFGQNGSGQHDIYELQVYNTSRHAICQSGIPDTIPTPARGMELVFSDDFDEGPLSISPDGRGTRYNAHKPTFGDFSGWPFRDPSEDAEGPFQQRDDYLVIQARKDANGHASTGLLATVDMDGNGFWAEPPFYMECRLLAQSAPGTWPAFWTVTNIRQGAGDELDVIEAYGGWGEGNPNSPDYWVTTHYWAQKDETGKDLKAPYKLVGMNQMGRHTSWSEEFHTYGLYVDDDHTIYYLDGQEVLSSPSNSYSSQNGHVVLINYAIGGASGWKIDLDRYGNRSNMYVDYLRVFSAAARRQ